MLKGIAKEVIRLTEKHLEKVKKEDNYQPENKKQLNDELMYYVKGSVNTEDEILGILSEISHLPLKKFNLSELQSYEEYSRTENFLCDIAEQAVFEKAKEIIEYDKYIM
jgi:hypothetical protein